jgi:hypothetical protein
VAQPESKAILDVVAIEGETVCKERDNLKLPDTKIEGDIDTPWRGFHGSTSGLEPVSIPKFKVIATHDDGQHAHYCFSIDT